MRLLEVHGLRKTYGELVVLDRLDLQVSPHECVAILGRSGSGKSTLLKLLDLLEEPDDGTIFLRGVDITDPRRNANRVRARLGMVFQAFNLFSHLNLRQNLELPGRLVHGLTRAQARERADQLLERVQLSAQAAQLPYQLSGGQQQRGAIARALMGAPDLLLLDEVTASLDPALAEEVVALLLDLKAEGTTMVLATHEVSVAKSLADRVMLLGAGEVLMQGPVSLLERPDANWDEYLGTNR